MLTDFHTHSPNTLADISLVDASGCTVLPAPTRHTLYSLGIHPCDIPGNWRETIGFISRAAANHSIAAIGECGFDRTSPFAAAQQENVFQALADISVSLRMPMVIHCVHAADILLRYAHLMPGEGMWAIHGFRGKPAAMLQLLDAGFAISFGAKANPDSIATCPTDRLLLETDTAPHSSLADTCRFCASLRGDNTGSIAAHNMQRILGIANIG